MQHLNGEHPKYGKLTGFKKKIRLPLLEASTPISKRVDRLEGRNDSNELLQITFKGNTNTELRRLSMRLRAIEVRDDRLKKRKSKTLNWGLVALISGLSLFALWGQGLLPHLF